jgi:hypothetical protein
VSNWASGQPFHAFFVAEISSSNEAVGYPTLRPKEESLAVWHNPDEMKCFIVSIDHSFQLIPLKGEVPIPEKKEQLRTLVMEIISSRNIDLICEESDPCYVSIAQQEAFRHEPRIQWTNINMTGQERLEAGIWEALLYRPFDTNFLDDHNAVTIHYRIPEDNVREEFFKDGILKAATAIRAKSVLVLCGSMHTEPLKTKLESAGFQVETHNRLTPEKNWK